MAKFAVLFLQIVLCWNFFQMFNAATAAENLDDREAKKLFCTWNFRGILNDINKFSEPYTSPLISGISREGSKPLNVYLELHIQTIIGLSTTRGLFEVDIFVSEIWQDKHFNFLSTDKIEGDKAFANVSFIFDELNDEEGSGDGEFSGVENDQATTKSAERNFSSTPYQSSPLHEKEFCRSYLNLGADVEKDIFTPNVNIWNSKMAKIHQSPTVNKFINVYADGTIWRNHRMKVQAPCQFDIKMYPFDAVECELIFQSYSYGSEDLNLTWHKNFPVTFVNEVSLADYDFINFSLEKSVARSHIEGSWDQLRIVFYFRRRFGFYFLQVYLPSSITVVMAWTAFFFEAKYSSTRVTIGINALLALSYQFDNMDIPRASQVKGYEVWMFMCMSFIFVSLAELAAALRVITQSKRKYLSVSCGASFRQSYERAQSSVKTVKNSMLNSQKMDQYTMILLPLIFIIGNVFYWFYYVNYMFFE